VTVDEEKGIQFRLGKEWYRYRGKATGSAEYKGKMAIAWFNPELPEYIMLTNRDHSNPVKVDRAGVLGAMDATPEELAREYQLKAEHKSGTKIDYRTCHDTFGQPESRLTLPDKTARQLSEAFRNGQEEHKTLVRESNKKNRLRRKVGMRNISEETTGEELEQFKRDLENLEKEI
jgi:hypothetical protein